MASGLQGVLRNGFISVPTDLAFSRHAKWLASSLFFALYTVHDIAQNGT